MQHRVVRRCIL